MINPTVEPKLADGFYIVEVEGGRTIAEWISDYWLPCGSDYDCWQYSDPPRLVKAIARINVETLAIEVML